MNESLENQSLPAPPPEDQGDSGYWDAVLQRLVVSFVFMGVGMGTPWLLWRLVAWIGVPYSEIPDDTSISEFVISFASFAGAAAGLIEGLRSPGTSALIAAWTGNLLVVLILPRFVTGPSTFHFHFLLHAAVLGGAIVALAGYLTATVFLAPRIRDLP